MVNFFRHSLGSIGVKPTQESSESSRRSSNGAQGAEELQIKLESAAEASHRRRFRITICTTVAASVPFFFCIVIFWLQQYFLISPYVWGYGGFYCGTVSWTGSIMLLGVMPNDAIIIRILALVLISAAGGTGCLCLGISAYAYFGNPVAPKASPSDPDIIICNQDGNSDAQLGCGLYLARYFVGSVVLFITAISFFPILRTYKGMAIYDRSQKKGFRFRDNAFKMPTRKVLVRLWFGLQICCFVPLGLVYIAYALSQHYVSIGGGADWYKDEEFIADLFFGVSWVMSAVVFTHKRRSAIMAWLTKINAEGETNSAAAVAALLGGRNASDSLKLAKNRFRSISMTNLSFQDFMHNREADGEMNTLFEKAVVTKLGSCDAFISHSWSDDGSSRYQALDTWAKDFKTKHGRDPKVWLDKACIDQNDISNDLLCLPIFTAGCDTLLVLAGRTYTQRLWCIIEVFVFLRMGGDVNRITVLPIDTENETEAISRFDGVDASRCQCHLESDRQKLLGVVEQGFGNFHEFNKILRHVFKKRMSHDSYIVDE